MNTTPTDTRPDYEVAKDELQALWASLGLRAEITGAHAAVEPADGKEGREWAHVAVIVTITRPLVIGQHKAASASFDWRMGTGLVDWKAIAKRIAMTSGRGSLDYTNAEKMAAYGSRFTPKDQAAICAKHLSAFVKAINPAEVLARCCQEGQDASERSFDEWASDYGYDTDSRKALETYEACQQSGTKARKLVDSATFAKLADLACRL